MRDENPIRTLGYYSKPSHEGYRNIIELLVPSPLSNNIRRILSEQGLDSRLTLKSTSTMRIESLLQCANINDRIDHTLKRTVDYAAGGRLRKMSAEKAWATIEELARYEDEGKVKQLEEYMGVIGSDFMQLSLEVVGKLKEEIRMEENRTKKIKKITREVNSFDEPKPQPQPLGYIDDKKLGSSLEYYHWIILGGRFNQLSHVSSPLLSKPGEYCIDEVFNTWMAFGGNTSDLGSFGEETDEITDLHQILEEVLVTERGDGVASIKRRRRDLFSEGVWNLETVSGRGQLKADLESST
ncbi:hypothetical protein Tco_1408334 [Tanacetum coccineum]